MPSASLHHAHFDRPALTHAHVPSGSSLVAVSTIYSFLYSPGIHARVEYPSRPHGPRMFPLLDSRTPVQLGERIMGGRWRENLTGTTLNLSGCFFTAFWKVAAACSIDAGRLPVPARDGQRPAQPGQRPQVTGFLLLIRLRSRRTRWRLSSVAVRSVCVQRRLEELLVSVLRLNRVVDHGPDGADHGDRLVALEDIAAHVDA
jgi:hypothetical protein